MEKTLRNLIRKVYHRSRFFRAVMYLPLDFLDWSKGIFGKDQEVLPPRRLNVTGRGPFLEIGREFLGHFIKYGGLQADQTVLDVGSGVGRMAIALTKYLNEQGQYFGFDIVPELVEWCQKNITPKHQNFHFNHFNAYNKLYNPAGVVRAQDLRFSYQDNYFDFVFLTSVFTHMLPADVRHYLSEISRVLKPGGKCLATFFLLNDYARTQIAAGMSKQNFVYDAGGYFTIDKTLPETDVAYEEGQIRELFSRNRLAIMEPIHHGLWSGRKEFLSYQDIIVAKKEAR